MCRGEFNFFRSRKDTDVDQIARKANGPAPVEYAHLPKPKFLKLKLTPSTAHMLLAQATTSSRHTADAIGFCSDVPVEGLVLEVVELNGGEHHDGVFQDRGIDLMP